MKRPNLVESSDSSSSPRGEGERRPRALFIVGAGTEIGKTYVTAALTRALREKGRSVLALKPLASGVPPIEDPAFTSSDTAILLAAQGLPITPETVVSCSPWRFCAPLAPDQAAAREGRTLALDELIAWCEKRLRSHPLPHPEARQRLAPRISSAARSQNERGIVLIEGVGGLMSPVTEDATGLDWLKRLRLSALLVTGSYLGAISHALTCVETMRRHGVPLVAMAVNESEGAPTSPEIVAQAITRHAGLPAHVVRRGGTFPAELAGLIEAWIASDGGSELAESC